MSGDGDRGGEGDGERDLRFVWCWSSVPGSCVSGDVIGDRGVLGGVVRAVDDRSSFSRSLVSGGVIGERGEGGSVGTVGIVGAVCGLVFVLVVVEWLVILCGGGIGWKT